jgi:hypothetical protein
MRRGRRDICSGPDRQPRQKPNERTHLLHPVVSGFLFGGGNDASSARDDHPAPGVPPSTARGQLNKGLPQKALNDCQPSLA